MFWFSFWFFFFTYNVLMKHSTVNQRGEKIKLISWEKCSTVSILYFSSSFCLNISRIGVNIVLLYLFVCVRLLIKCESYICDSQILHFILYPKFFGWYYQFDTKQFLSILPASDARLMPSSAWKQGWLTWLNQQNKEFYL